MKGEILCLVGENGSGKSTMIKIISGVYHPDQGDTLLMSIPIRN
jgi:simple sugar transport system ATP-binding protein